MNARLLLAAPALALAGCITFSFERDLRFVPLSDAAIESLHPGEARLEQCLDHLGAPLYVWEYKENGMALAYGWEKSRSWNVAVSVPVTQAYSVTGSYTGDDAKLRGVVLLFDRDLKLEMVRRGFLRALRDELQHKPAPVGMPPEGEDPTGAKQSAAPAPLGSDPAHR